MYSRTFYVQVSDNMPFTYSKFVCDTHADLEMLPTNTQKSADNRYGVCAIGSTAFVVEEGEKYILTPSNGWQAIDLDARVETGELKFYCVISEENNAIKEFNIPLKNPATGEDWTWCDLSMNEEYRFSSDKTYKLHHTGYGYGGHVVIQPCTQYSYNNSVCYESNSNSQVGDNDIIENEHTYYCYYDMNSMQV